jgi:AP-4 complex subunit beta-1
VEILPMLSNPDTAPDIVAELAELVNHTDTRLSRLAMRSMARIACRDTGGPGCSESIAQRMVEMLDYNIDHIQAEAASALTLMIRKHPTLKEFASLSLARTLKYVQEPHGKASIIFLLSECGDVVQEAPYALEKLIDNYDTIKDVAVKHTLLNATMKLFFQRPPEVQRMLGRLLLKATDDVTSQDLHDRALLYYRLLKCGADPKTIIGQIVATNTVISKDDFAEDDDAVMRQELMEEFNTLAIVYGKASYNFISPDFQVSYRKMPNEHPLDDNMGASEGHVPMAPQALPQPAILQEETALMDGGSYDQAAAATAAPVDNMIGDLLGFDMPAPAVSAPTSTVTRIALASAVTMTGEDYQAKWGGISDADSIVSTAALSSIPSSTDVVESALGSVNVFTMASGELPNEFKFFLYAQDSESGSMVLIQSNIGKQDSEPLMILTCKVTGSDKASDQRKVDQLMELVQSVLG